MDLLKEETDDSERRGKTTPKISHWVNCRSLVVYSWGFNIAHMQMSSVLAFPCSEKWASSVHTKLNKHCGSFTIFARSHKANDSLSALSGD
ncbi:hypothetical protein AVEN_254945-1 [Araneus ventricosus]|uniref:Uncharacterized protein n=1 Tax=Araneus ventricosus TaxID=182803 RepID=A0A4Y2EK58_ARAVE|nr:hypothetical protein AVEN_254945-1 [Araneus ventricosus]